MENERASILVVDDLELNRAILCELFSKDYNVIEAENGVQALELIEKHNFEIAVVLLDLVMPVMGGMDVLRIMSKRHWIERIPVIMISADSSVDAALQGYNLGVTDFISKPFNPEIVRQRIGNTVELFRHRFKLESMLAQQAARLKKTTSFVIDALSTAVEFRSGESGQHIRRVRGITRTLMTKMAKSYPQYKITSDFIDTVSEASAMHDIGKIAIPDSILLKPGKLTPDEFEIMKTHTTQGCKLLENLRYTQDDLFYDQCYMICRHHHERWDGRGYPDGLSGDDIPLSAQVVSIADVYDALTSERVYKNAFSHEAAVDMMMNGECGVFNPLLLKCFHEVADNLREQAGMDQAITFEPEHTDVPAKYHSPKLRLYARHGSLRKARTRRDFMKLSERTLRLVELEREKYRLLTELSGEITFDYSTAKNVVTFSEKFNETFGVENRIPQVRQWIKSSDVIYYQDRQRIEEFFKTLSQSRQKGRLEVRLRIKSGDYEWFEIKACSVNGGEGGRIKGMIGKLTNINVQKLELERLSLRAAHDTLTGVLNRSEFRSAALKVFESKSSKCALMMLDIDNFKSVNDILGHAAGDELLRQLATRLLRFCYPSDFVGRVGGDEFVILITHRSGKSSLEAKAEKVLRIFREAAESIAVTKVSASIGIALYPDDSADFDELNAMADQALYRAKQRGKDQFIFYGCMNE